MTLVYICHSITNSGQNLDVIDGLVAWLQQQKHRVVKPKFTPFPSKVASDTLEKIELADLIIGDVTVYSHGVGFELGYAYAISKKIIVVAHESARTKVSKFIMELFPQTIFYVGETDLIEAIAEQTEDAAEWRYVFAPLELRK